MLTSFINLFLVKSFADPKLEASFLHNYRRGSLPYIRAACALSMFIAGAFFVAEATIGRSSWTQPGQLVRLGKLCVLVAVWLLIHYRTAWILRHYVVLGVLVVSSLMIGTASLVLTYPLHAASYAPWVMMAAFTTGLILTYGYCRLPTGVSVLICTISSLVLLAASAQSMQGSDLLIRMVINLLVTNAAGIGLTVVGERRERRVFLQQIEIEQARSHSEREARAAQEATQAKTRVLSAVAHDLRQPMMGLMARTDMLVSRPASTSLSDLRDHLQALQTTVAAMDGHLQTLLDLSQTQLSSEPFEVQDLRLAPILIRLREVFLEAARQQGVELRVRVPRAACWGLINAPRLFDLLSQLVWNAVKYARLEHNPRPRVLIGVRRDGHDRWQIVIADNGIGMNESVRTRMFDEYFQGHISERSRRLGGYGLGMSQVRVLLRRLPQHDLSVRSEPGRGTYFALSLSRCAPPLEQRQLDTDPRSIEKADLTALRGRYVLLVDDRPDVCAALEAALQSIGLLVDAAIDFNAALQTYACAERDFDLILTDYELDEGHTGAELLRALRKRGCRAPALLITSNQTNASADEQALFVQTLIKPLPVSQLAAACLHAIHVMPSVDE